MITQWIIKRSTPMAVLLALLLSGCGSVMSSAYKGDIIGVKEHVKKGEDVNVQDRYGYTPLIWTAYYNYYNVAEYLLENGADPDIQDKRGQTALIMAAYYGHAGIVRVLLEHKANVNLADKWGKTALAYAEQYNFTEISAMLRGKGGRQYTDTEDTTKEPDHIVYLTDGSKIIGKIVSQSRTQIVIKTKYTTMTIEKDKIKEMRFK